MKKIIFLFLALLFVVAVDASAQGRDARFRDGITHFAYPHLGQMSTTDSLHYIGRFFLRNTDLTPFDSLTFHITNTDSLRFGVLVKVGGPKYTSDTIRVVLPDGATGATHYVQLTAAAATKLPWHSIITATGGEAQTAQYLDVYLWIYKVGTETPGSTLSGDTVNLLPKAYD